MLDFAAHIAVEPIPGYDFPPPMFRHEFYEFEAFDHLEEAVADWKTLFNPLEGNLTTAFLHFPEPGLENREPTSVPDIVMLSQKGDLGKWNFGLEVQVRWGNRSSSPASVNANVFDGEGSPAQPPRTPQNDQAEGSVLYYYFTHEPGKIMHRIGWACPWCEGPAARLGSVDELDMHLKLNHESFSFRFEVFVSCPRRNEDSRV